MDHCPDCNGDLYAIKLLDATESTRSGEGMSHVEMSYAAPETSASFFTRSVAKSGTVMVVVNSVCGCAAGKARPGIAIALQHANKPDVVATVFAGADIESTARAREHMAPYPPSSPSVALFRDGRLVYMLERRDIEGRDAGAIALLLRKAFDEHCAADAAMQHAE